MSEFKFGNLNYKILILLLSLRVCEPGSPGCVLKDLLMGKRTCDAPGYNCFHGPAIAPSAAAAPARCLSRGVPSSNARYGCISMLDTSPAVVCGTTCRAETVAPTCLGGLKLKFNIVKGLK